MRVDRGRKLDCKGGLSTKAEDGASAVTVTNAWTTALSTPPASAPAGDLYEAGHVVLLAVRKVGHETVHGIVPLGRLWPMGMQ